MLQFIKGISICKEKAVEGKGGFEGTKRFLENVKTQFELFCRPQKNLEEEQPLKTGKHCKDKKSV